MVWAKQDESYQNLLQQDDNYQNLVGAAEDSQILNTNYSQRGERLLQEGRVQEWQESLGDFDLIRSIQSRISRALDYRKKQLF